MKHDKILRTVSRYYSSKLKVYGPTPRGVDWNSAESQTMRFDQLLKVCGNSRAFSLNDYGCGYGGLVNHLRTKAVCFQYSGFDISPAMIVEAKRVHSAEDDVNFVQNEADLSRADYTTASGIFNVKLHTPDSEWEDYVFLILRSLNRLSAKGFAFNILTRYSDPAYRRNDLYYADPLLFFDYCKNNFSPYVSLIHDYPLYEFTILVTKR